MTLLRILSPYKLGDGSIKRRVNDPNDCFLGHRIKAVAKLWVNHDSNCFGSISHV